jgi:hypothetical protein
MSRSLLLSAVLLCGCGGPAVTLRPSTVTSVQNLAAVMLREAKPGAVVHVVDSPAEIRKVSSWRNPWAATHVVTMDVIVDGNRQTRELFVANGHLVHIGGPTNEASRPE